MSISDQLRALLEKVGVLETDEGPLQDATPGVTAVPHGAESGAAPNTPGTEKPGGAHGTVAGSGIVVEPPPPAFASRIVPQIMEDGGVTLHVLVSARADPQFLTYQHQLLHAGHHVVVHPVDGRELREIARDQKSDGLAIRGNTQRTQAIIREILEDAATREASDIHIEVRGRFCSVDFRIDGGLTRITEYSRADGEAFQRAIYQGYSNGDASYTRHTYQVAQIKHAEDRSADVVPDSVDAIRLQRGPLHPDGEYTVLRLLYRIRRRREAARLVGGESRSASGHRTVQPGLNRGLRIFEDFGYTNDQALILARCARAPEGLVIFSGPTGSAKSSALKVALEFQHILYPQKSIFTIEDPPEYEIEGAKQLAVLNAHGEAARKSGFSEALRVVLRSDPDILMVGEIRDEATAGAALDAVITGHQMWSTVHAMDPYLIITRLLRFGLDARDFMDATILRALVGQRLIGMVCDHCAVPFEGHEQLLDADIAESVRALCTRSGQSPAQIRLRAPIEFAQKCNHCNGTGIAGRKIVSEIVEIDDEFIAQLRDGAGVESARAWKRARPGHISMLRHGIRRMFAGEADPREIVSVVGDLNAEVPDNEAIEVTPGIDTPTVLEAHSAGEQ